MRTLTALVIGAGHADFRDARGPLGFTQRQASGKFTRDEAAALIERLEASHAGDSDSGDSAPATAVSERRRLQETALRKLPSEVLAQELDRRGWIVIAP
jgi:hypothetical protein